MVPWTNKETVDEEALTPETVPLSAIMLLATEVAAVNLDKKPLVPLLPTLLLNVSQSAEASCPVLVMLAVGKLITKALVEVEILKMLPAVPVETLLMTLAPKDKVILPLPLATTTCWVVPVKVALDKVLPEELTISSWPSV